MDLKEIFRKHLLKIFLVFIGVQLGIFALVQNLNHRPKAIADQMDVIEGRSIKISPLTNDNDKDDKDILILSNFSTPKHGTVKQKDNILMYFPNKDFVGKDSLTYTVTDGKKESKPATIAFQVLKNKAPIVHNDMAVVYPGGSTVIYALDNDTDREKDSMFISETTMPLYGDLNVAGNKIFYSAGKTAATEDSFYYAVSDGKSSSQKASVKIKIQKKTDSCYPWLALDIGDVSIPGEIKCTGNSIKIQASGSDIWTNSDGYYFVFQLIQGDFQISAKIDSLEGSHEWTKTGFMVRENLNAASKNVFIGMTTKNGITTQARLDNNEYTDNGKNKSGVKAPYWIKLSREGDLFGGAISTDGKNWEKLEGISLPMAGNAYVGIAVTSHDNNIICKTVLSNYLLKGKTTVFTKP